VLQNEVEQLEEGLLKYVKVSHTLYESILDKFPHIDAQKNRKVVLIYDLVA
jgi:hypothetical protein